MKYPVNREFYPYAFFTAPSGSPKLAGFLGSLMRPPRWLFRHHEVKVTRESVRSADGGECELLFFEPYGIEEPCPCLVYYHGGGFFFGAAGHHYRMAIGYAEQTPCKLAFVNYRLAPKHPHPIPCEDCYAALCHIFAHAEERGIDRTRIAVAGDSAGGALAAAVCRMAQDRGSELPCLQMLIYPVTDRRMQSESCRRYTDTPMWNSRLNAKMWQGYLQSESPSDLAYASPMEGDGFAGLPPAYIETAEFDCLHDEGLAYADALRAEGIAVCVNETKGTVHGFDAVEKAPTSRAAVSARIAYLREHLLKDTAEN